MSRAVRWLAMALLVALLVATTSTLQAQLPAVPDSLIQKYRADFAVPDAPALTLLDLDGSALVRPSTVRELAVALSDFTSSGGGLQLPKAAAVEFSPGLLFFGRRLKLSDYQRNAALYRLRVSVATSRAEGSGSPTSLALAVRTSFKDAADLRDASANPAFFRQVQSLIDSAQKIDAAAEDAAESGGINAPVVYTPKQQKALDGLNDKFKKLNAAYADSAWNRTAFDAAIGLRADAADSTGKDISVQQYAAWLTYAGRVKSWGQVVFGAQMASVRDSTNGKFGVGGTAAFRFYAGDNREKVYLDLQASKHTDLDTEYLLGGGAEMGLGSGFWLALSVGSQWGGVDGDGKFRARFAFKSAFPMR